jgi:histidinol dehydrogenase
MNVRAVSLLQRDVDRARRGGAFGSKERAAAATIVRAVREDGDAAVLRTVRRFDRRQASLGELVVDAGAIRRAARGCDAETRGALDIAHARIKRFHQRQRPRTIRRADALGETSLSPAPLGRVGALVPRGRVSYPSTVLMTGVPARVAGVGVLVVASPMSRDGSLDPALAYALALVEADLLYRAGGAAAVAALAYGTRSLDPVDKIVGPGNGFSAAAKWLVSADVGIDALQGPSELIVIASGDADPRTLTLDLLAQAEHGAGSFAAIISDEPRLLRAVGAALKGNALTRIAGYRAADLRAAARAANDAAPEHLLLAGRRAAALADGAWRAGAVFVGSRSAVAFGDYVAGTNHSLPTGGTARWSSALRVDDFVRWTSRVALRGDLRALATAGTAIASHEGMRYHGESMAARV